MIPVALLNTSRKPRFNRGSSFQILFIFAAILGALSAASAAVAQSADRPWMNPGLAPDERAVLVLKQMTLNEYSTAMPSSLGAISNWDVDSTCEFGTVIGRELRALGFNMTLGGGVDLAREPRNGRSC